ncbi:MAG: hypothetical protein GY841_04600 [FCB group bacterium]|nr:hypothetical protein [FCB group bacterium]
MADIRLKIIAAAHECGIDKPSHFGILCESQGVCTKRHGVNYYTGMSDLAGHRLDKLLKYFKLEVSNGI